jgi:aspartate carbamoyltransferase regulatory subunit
MSKHTKTVKKHLKIEKIKNGTVIDHIKHGKAPEVLKILGIDESFQGVVAIAINVPSKIQGKKDIVKVENRDLNGREVNKIAIISPNATINKIRDYKVVEKCRVELPREIVGIIKCSNPSCITNKSREPVIPKFLVKSRDPIILSCKYCEREVREGDL